MADVTCTVPECGTTKIFARGWCRKHYARWQRTGTPEDCRRSAPKPERLCSVDGCEKPHKSNDYCAMHHRRWYIHGDASIALRDRDHATRCAVAGCDRPYATKGHCATHARRVRQHGVAQDFRLTLAERFWAQVVEVPSGCWLWTGRLSSKGYGLLNIGPGKSALVHRWSYEFMTVEIPPGLDLDHVCHNNDLDCAGDNSCEHRRCVNPEHLEPVTHLVNIRRGRARRQRKLLLAA